MEKINIRLATVEDSETIFEYINKLATYEKMLDEVTGSVELIKKNIFENHYANSLIISYEEKVVGFAVFFYGFSTFTTKGTLYLEDVFVDEEYRHKGIGFKVFEFLANHAKEKDLTRFEWVCLDWNQPSIDFYKGKLNASALDEWIRFRLDGQDLLDLASE